jgi:hypothetical protein
VLIGLNSWGTLSLCARNALREAEVTQTAISTQDSDLATIWRIGVATIWTGCCVAATPSPFIAPFVGVPIDRLARLVPSRATI